MKTLLAADSSTHQPAAPITALTRSLPDAIADQIASDLNAQFQNLESGFRTVHPDSIAAVEIVSVFTVTEVAAGDLLAQVSGIYQEAS